MWKTDSMFDFVAKLDDLVWTVIVAGMVSGGISYFFRSKEMRKSAQIDYEYEQKKQLYALIGKYNGRLIGASARFSSRMWNLYENDEEDWIKVSGDFDRTGYYFESSVFRFMELSCLLRQIEKEAILLDIRIADKRDFLFLNYVSAMQRQMSDATIIKTQGKSTSKQSDHFFSDMMRKYCDICLEKGEFPAFEEFQKLISNDSKIYGVLEFFDGISKNENRTRWDRLVCLHLIVLTFLNSFGYKRDKTSQSGIHDCVKEFKYSETKTYLAGCLSHFDLSNDKSVIMLNKSLQK